MKFVFLIEEIFRFRRTGVYIFSEKYYVLPAVRNNFLLQKSEEKNGAIIALKDSLDGPQEIILELILRLSINGVFQSKYIANLVINVAPHRRQRSTPSSESLTAKNFPN